ncbi:MAG: hypothetical protein ABUS57_03555, partial [Pseudomonadota bacterium]
MTEQDVLMQGVAGPSLANETLELMRQHGIAPTGQNYEVWLAYRLGSNATLREAIDERIASREPFTSELNTELFERFFTGVR